MSNANVDFRVEDVSPLITYSPQDLWHPGRRDNDNQFDSYSGNGTFTLSTTNGASASFQFYGSAILIAGAKRPNHGPYSVNLDGQVTNGDGFNGAGQFQTPLFQQSNLQEGTHTVVITNLENDINKQFIDIDFIQWTTSVKGDGTQSLLDDTSGSITYQGSWSTDASSMPSVSGNTVHSTTSKNAVATLNFQGDAVEVLGPVGPQFGQYTVALNSGTARNMNLTRDAYTASTTIYMASGLGNGNHTVVFTGATNGMLAIDQVRITNFQGKGEKSGISTGAIAGIAIGAVAAMALIAVAVGLFLWRKKKQRAMQGPAPYPPSDAGRFTGGAPSQMSGATPYQPSVYQQNPNAPYTPQSFVQAPPTGTDVSFGSSSHQQLLNANQHGNGTWQSQNVGYAPSQASSSARLPYMAGGSAVDDDGMSTTASTYSNPMSRANSSVQQRPSMRKGGYSAHNATNPSISSSSNNHSSQPNTPYNPYVHNQPGTAPPVPAQYPPVIREKGRVLPNAPSINTAGTGTAGGAVSPDRMQLDGRAQDAGPMLLPPAYEQATEPYPKAF